MLKIIRCCDNMNLFDAGFMYAYSAGCIQQFILLTLISCTY